MSHRELITQQLQASMDEASAVGLCELITTYNFREPLIDGIRRGDPFLWKSEQVRELIAKTLAGEKPPKGRPKVLDHEHRNLRVMIFLHYWHATGLPVYADIKNGRETACDKAAECFHLHEQTVRGIWKERRKDAHPLYDIAKRAGAAKKETK